MNNFIGEWFIEDLSICDRLIKCFNESDKKSEGAVGNENGVGVINSSVKKSTEMTLRSVSDKNLVLSYFKELQNVLDYYIDEYKFCNKYAPFHTTEEAKIQHYKPNEGYYAWHTERTTSKHPFSSRHLVFMTYLNDVEDGGETEFYYQELKVKPRKGLTLIWPADWTHTHRGVTSPTQDKYIVTGWFNYIVEKTE
jgi:hypothetical protein